jgi:hypothetical protein
VNITNDATCQADVLELLKQFVEAGLATGSQPRINVVCRPVDLANWRRMPARRRWLLLEATVDLLAARLVLKLIPFRRLTWLFERRVSRPELTGPLRDNLKREVRWAIVTAARRFPERIVCFPRAVAAQAMLRRRGESTTLWRPMARQRGG